MARKDRHIHDDGARAAWYGRGLRFACTGCGACCTGGHGYVWVDVEEIRRLAARLDMGLDAFGRRFLRRIGGRYALLDDPDSGACVFLVGNACSLYEDRPAQCRSYPFWPEVLASPRRWRREAEACEGIRPDAPEVPAAEIRRALASVPPAGHGSGFASAPGRSKVKGS
jgi:Fe-S-cluster containining protein